MFDIKAILSMLMLVVFGTASTTTSKVLVTSKTYGFPPDESTPQYPEYLAQGPTGFDKSFSLSFIMFIGMGLVYPVWILISFIMCKRKGQQYRFPERRLIQFFQPLLPACCDCAATTLQLYSLRYVAASTEAMLSGSSILFTAALSFFFLKKKIWAYQFIAIFTAICALILIGSAELGKPSEVEGTVGERALGVGMILLSFFIQSVQNVFLEKILEGLEPLEIVGLQGIWGTIVVLALCVPITYFIPGSEFRAGVDADGNALTSFESIVDTFYRIAHNGKIAALYFSYMVILFFFNIGVIAVVNYTSAINYTIVVTIRSLLVWIIFLIVGAVVGVEGKLGEHPYAELWSNWSYLQLAGFIVNLGATIINNRFIEFPCLSYPSVVPESESPLEKSESSSSSSESSKNECNEKI